MNSQITVRRHFLKKLQSPLTIGFTAIADFTSFIGQEYLAGIIQACRNYGVNFINMTSAIRPTLFIDTSFFKQYLAKIPFMRAPLLDGLITWASSLSGYMKNEEIQNLFENLSTVPRVDIGYLDIPGVPSIRIDNDYSIHLLVKHLVKVHKFSDIAFFGSKFSHPHLLRLNSYRKAMADFNLPVSDNMIFLADSLDEQDVAAQVDRFLKNKKRPSAILTSSDIIAHTVIEELEKNGIRVPEDIAVTGFNNQLAGLTSTSPITTIDLAYFKRGYEAVELLIDQIMGSTPEKDRTVPTSLVVRQSCGCFEEAIIDAMTGDFSSFAPPPASDLKNENEIRLYLEKSLSTAFPFSANLKKRKAALISAIVSDLSSGNSSSTNILSWFRREITSQKYSVSSIRSSINSSLTNEISTLRRIILPLVSGNPELLHKIENIFQALRSLHTIHDRYEMISEQAESYKPANLMNLALTLSSCENLRQIENTLRIKLPGISISGIILCLSPFLSENLEFANIEMIFPDRQSDFFGLLPIKVREPAVFPKKLFPNDSPFFLTLIPLYPARKFLGYAYINMNENGNLALYDDLQELLSQNLYRIYVKEGKTKPNTLITNRDELIEKVPITTEESSSSLKGKLTGEAVVDYLLDHIDEACDLDKMANFFGMSKSYLVRRVRELTGYTTQTLHERLKIEQAKKLIKSGKMKMNDIASRLGFSNPNYFSNVFKKVTGMRPTQFAQSKAAHK